jgi:hypothetical protein
MEPPFSGKERGMLMNKWSPAAAGLFFNTLLTHFETQKYNKSIKKSGATSRG